MLVLLDLLLPRREPGVALGELRGASARESLGLRQLGLACLELLLELGGCRQSCCDLGLSCCDLVLKRRKPCPFGVQLLPLGGQALLALPDRAFRSGEPRAALVELRLLVRDFVLLAELPFVRFDLLGKGDSQLALPLLSLLQLGAKLLELAVYRWARLGRCR